MNTPGRLAFNPGFAADQLRDTGQVPDTLSRHGLSQKGRLVQGLEGAPRAEKSPWCSEHLLPLLLPRIFSAHPLVSFLIPSNLPGSLLPQGLCTCCSLLRASPLPPAEMGP